MSAPQVPVQIVQATERLEAALRFAAGAARGSTLPSALNFLCTQIASLLASPIASVYVLEGRDELVLRGNHGFPSAALGEVRLQVGQGITGTAVETMRPVTVADAGLVAQFAYFPQLAEERYPAFLAVPLLEGQRPRGALVLQREQGPFTDADVLLAVSVTPALVAAIGQVHPTGASAVLKGVGNDRGRALGQAFVLSRALPRRAPERERTAEQHAQARALLEQAFEVERDELRGLLDRARAALGADQRALAPLGTVVEDARTQERALELFDDGLSPALAVERVAAEAGKALFQAGAGSVRAVDVEAFLGAVSHRLAGFDAERGPFAGRARRGEVLVGVHLPGPAALRAWASGATAAVCSSDAADSTGVALLTALEVPVVSGVRAVFEWMTSGCRVAVDAGTGELLVNPSQAQAASFRK
jgi:phosphotransferase system enzyme I (PtsP)